MIKLLIVDDERTIRNGLMHHISWQSLGVDMVQSAENAEEALSACELFRPDIVLSDIRMRGMSGVEMCTRIRELYPDCQIIFVSGYSDKEYLKAAISLGAVDYIEKPVSPQQLSDAVWKAVQICEENQKKIFSADHLESSRGVITQVVLHALAYGDYPENFEKSMEFSGMFSQTQDAYRFCVLHMEKAALNVSRFQHELQGILQRLPDIERGGEYAAAFLDDRDFCILLSGDREAIGDDCPFLEALRSRIESLSMFGNRFFMSAGTIVQNPMLLYSSFGYIQSSMRELFFKGWGKCAVQDASRPVIPVRYNKSLNSAFAAAFAGRDEQAVDRTMEEIYRVLVSQTDADPEEIRSIYYTVDYQMNLEYERRVYAESATDEGISAVSAIGSILQIETLEELHAFMVRRAHHLIEVWTMDDENCSAVLQVTRIMRENYSDKNLSVKSLAESVYLTPTYLSSLFKKRTGKTIGQYLTELRIENSMKLLMDKQLKLYHVAEMVGYDDPNYFAKIFKRHVGMTPSEFREKKLL